MCREVCGLLVKDEEAEPKPPVKRGDESRHNKVRQPTGRWGRNKGKKRRRKR